SYSTSGHAKLTWRHPKAKDAICFIIYKSTDGISFSPLKMLTNDTSYEDLSCNSRADTALYYVVALDSCGIHPSISSDTVLTLHLSTHNGGCKPKIDLNWYGIFNNSGYKFKVYRSENLGKSWMELKTLPYSTTGFTDFNVNRQKRYVYRLE